LLYAPGFRVSAELRAKLDALHAAAQQRQIVLVAYAREDGQPSVRRLHPLALYFWGGTWTLAAWCELRDDFRSFRVDRMQHLENLNEIFEPRPGQTLNDFLRRVRAESESEANRPKKKTTHPQDDQEDPSPGNA
jgi:predicted DNA-binding transcriptional regulator YafY